MHNYSPELGLRNVAPGRVAARSFPFQLALPSALAYGRKDGEVLLLLTVVGRGPAEGWNGAGCGIAEDAVISERGGRAGNSRGVEGNFRIGNQHRSVVLQTGAISRDQGII